MTETILPPATEFLRLYPYSDYKDRLAEFKYYSRVGNPLDNTDYIVFFQTEYDMIAYDNWNNIPPPNAQELIDKGRNLYKKIWSK